MEINIGDKVRFLNDVGGGTVVKMLTKASVIVRDKDDFEYPFPIAELVLIEKGRVVVAKPEEQKPEKEIPKIEKPNISKPELKNDNISEIICAFIKSEDKNSDSFDCYLVNDSNFYVFYHIVILGDSGYEKLDAETLEPNTKIMFSKIDRQRINNSKELTIQMMFFGHPYQTLHEMVERKIKIVPVKFYHENSFIDNDFFDEKAYVFELLKEKPGLGQSIKTSEDFENSILLKEIVKDEEEEEDKSRRYKPRKEAPVVEVDLHINKLVDSVIGMSNAEIIKIQLDVFHKTLTDAILNRASKVILIHGIGNGTLKTAIRESLSVQYKLEYEDASFKEYGFGATMVMMGKS